MKNKNIITILVTVITILAISGVNALNIALIGAGIAIGNIIAQYIFKPTSIKTACVVIKNEDDMNNVDMLIDVALIEAGIKH